MENIFNGLPMADITAQAKVFFQALAPYTMYLVGLLLAFFVISFIVSLFRPNHEQAEFFDDDFDDDY